MRRREKCTLSRCERPIPVPLGFKSPVIFGTMGTTPLGSEVVPVPVAVAGGDVEEEPSELT